MILGEDSYGPGIRVLVLGPRGPSLEGVVPLLSVLGCTHEWLSGPPFEVISVTRALARADIVLCWLDDATQASGAVFKSIMADEEDRQVVVLTTDDALEAIIAATSGGAVDYIVLPPRSQSSLAHRLARLVEMVGIVRAHWSLITELEQKNQALEAMVILDPLTGLFNHAYFQERLTNEISRCKRYGHELGCLFIDVDNFKTINDTLGHPKGDEALREIAAILQGGSRETDYHFRLREHDIAARYGGDEFVLVLPDTCKSGTAITAERLRRFVERHDFGDGFPTITLSIGVAAFPEDAKDRGSLVHAADTALYIAKNSGRNQVVAYSSEIAQLERQSDAMTKVELVRLNALAWSIAERAFRFVYQPILDAKSGRVVGYEALCRPLHEAFDSPLELFRTAERAGRMTELGRVLRSIATEPLSRLPEGVRLFVNLHPQELNDAELVQGGLLSDELRRRVVFEINRSRSIKDQERLNVALGKLKSHGYGIALDDIRTGYLGLNTLVLQQPDFVKINARTLAGVGETGRTARLVRHFLELVAEERITVIVDEIETAEERRFVDTMDYPLIQGFLVGNAVRL